MHPLERAILQNEVRTMIDDSDRMENAVLTRSESCTPICPQCDLPTSSALHRMGSFWHHRCWAEFVAEYNNFLDGEYTIAEERTVYFPETR